MAPCSLDSTNRGLLVLAAFLGVLLYQCNSIGINSSTSDKENADNAVNGAVQGGQFYGNTNAASLTSKTVPVVAGGQDGRGARNVLYPATSGTPQQHHGKQPGRCAGASPSFGGESAASPLPLKKLFWLHFPKAGTSFGATAMYYACPRLPPDAVMPEVDALTASQKAVFTGSLIQLFLDEYNIGDESRPGYLLSAQAPDGGAALEGSSATSNDYCNADGYDTTRKVVSHFPVEPALADSKRGIAMFRRPGARIRSAYNHGLHAFRMPERQHNKMEKRVKNSKEFAEWGDGLFVKSCQTKMMLGEFCGRKMTIDEEQFAEAKRRLESGLAFIGLVEHWELSICLFHAMFGGSPREAQFANTRKGNALDTHKVANYVAADSPNDGIGDDVDEETLGDDVAKDADDPWDSRLYEAAKAIFMERLQEHDMSHLL